jgi:hypothetical protein
VTVTLLPDEAVELRDLLTEMNEGRPVWMLPIRVVDLSDGSTQKLPKGKWNEAQATREGVRELWDEKNGGHVGIHLQRSGLVLADQDYPDIPADLVELLTRHPTFTSESLRRGLPHYWYRNPDPTPDHCRDRKWMWSGTHVGDLKAKGIGVLGPIVRAVPFAPLPDELDKFRGSGEVVADGNLRLLVTAWLNWLDEPPPLEESLAWVRYSLTALEQAQPGERNNMLYRAARDIAQLAAAGAVTPQEGVLALYDSAGLVFSDEELRTEVRATVESAFEREKRSHD